MNNKLLMLLMVCLPAWGSASLPKHTDPCDSLFLSNGRGYAVKNLETTPEGVSFVFCDDPSAQVNYAPWLQVDRIKKTDGTEMLSPARPKAPVVDTVPPEPPLNDEEQILEDKVIGLEKTAKWIIPLMFVGGLGIFLSIIVLITAKKRMKEIVGHPREAKLLRILKKIRRKVWIVLGAFFAVLAFFIGWIIQFANAAKNP